MKKLTSILLAVLMLTSVFVSCVGDDNTTTTDIPTTEAPTTEAPTTEAPTTEAPTTEAPTTEAPTTNPSGEYNITYELNGGTNNSENPVTYKEGETVALFVPEKEGYAFGGWYTDSEFSNAITQIKDMAKDVTLYAKWTTGYKINYVLNGGVNNVNNPYSYETGKFVFLSQPEKENCVFAGWYKDPEFTISESFVRSDAEGDVTFYAKWNDICGELILELNGDSYTVKDCNEEATLVTIPESYNGIPVTKIGEYAFYSCDNLEELIIPDNITYIGKSAFTSCSKITSITIPDSVISPLIGTFSGCKALTEVTIGSGVTDIETTFGNAFGDCLNLSKITVSEENNFLRSVGGILYSKDGKNLICFPASLNLTTYEIPEGITEISNYAFAHAKYVKKMKLPKTLKSWDLFSFYYFDSLEEIIVDEEHTEFRSVSGVLYSKDMKKLILYPSGCITTNYTIPEGVTSIEKEAFMRCSNLRSVNIPQTVNKIGTSAFHECFNLESIVIPKGVTQLEGGTFMACSKLRVVTLPDGLTAIGAYEFYKCESLETINMPSTLKSIDEYAFEKCKRLGKIYIYSGVTIIKTDAFKDCIKLILLCEATDKSEEWYKNLSKHVSVLGLGATIEEYLNY